VFTNSACYFKETCDFFFHWFNVDKFILQGKGICIGRDGVLTMLIECGRFLKDILTEISVVLGRYSSYA